MVTRLIAAIALFLMSVTAVSATQRFIPLLQPGDAIVPIPLVAQDGRAFGLSDVRGKAVVISFIYTRCADARMCPLVSAKFAVAQHAIGTDPIRLVLISLDPVYDTPHVLARYGRAFGQNPRIWTLATGSHAAIDELAGRLGIASATTAPGAIVHTEGAIIVDPAGRIVRTIDGNAWSPSELVAAARATLPGNTDPWVGGRAWLSATMQRCGGGNVALGGMAMLLMLILAIGLSGTAFWFAFRAAPTDAQRTI